MILCTVNDCSMEDHALFYNLQGSFTDDAQTDLWFILPAKSNLKAFECSHVTSSYQFFSPCVSENVHLF